MQVKQRTLPKSISCGKTFRDHTSLHTLDKVHYWLLELAKELEERVIEDRKANARLPQLLTVNVYSPPGPGQAAAPPQVNSMCFLCNDNDNNNNNNNNNNNIDNKQQ